MPIPNAINSAGSAKVLLSAFADEAANRKTAIEQLSALSAIGLRYYSLRFIDIDGTGAVKHVVEMLDDAYRSAEAV